MVTPKQLVGLVQQLVVSHISCNEIFKEKKGPSSKQVTGRKLRSKVLLVVSSFGMVMVWYGMVLLKFIHHSVENRTSPFGLIVLAPKKNDLFDRVTL